MKRMNKVVSLTVATALLLSSMDMMGVRASEKITEDTGVTKEQPLREFTEVPELQAVTASTPTVKVTPTAAPTNSKDFVIENGVLTKYNGKEKNVVIPDGVTEIGYCAFEECETMESVTIPEGVIKIGNYSFYRCVNLKKVDFPKTLKSIGWNSFEYCNSLECLVIPEGVTTIGRYGFSECKKLKSIELPKTLKTIEKKCFSQCSNLEQVIIPEGVTQIEERAFSGCKKIKSIELPKTLKKIGLAAFEGCKKIKSIELPKTLKKIGACAFEDCSSLERAVIPEGVVEIESDAFSGCKKLKSIELPKTLKTIGDCAFEECSSLKQVVIPEGVKKLSYEVFSNCYNLEKIVIPEGVTSIEMSAFESCCKLQRIQLPKKITAISSNTFLGCSNLEKIEIPKSVKSIDSRAFKGCSKLKSVTIPATVKSIMSEAFADCKNLAKVQLPKKVDIGENAFKGTKWLDKQRGKQDLVVVNGILIDGHNCSGNVTIPENVTKIGEGAFRDSKKITSVKFHKGVTEIGDYAFYGCKNLHTVSFTKGLKSIGACAFEFTGLSTENIDLPEGLKKIERGAFDHTKGKSVVIPKSVTKIGWLAFGVYGYDEESEPILSKGYTICGYNKTAKKYASYYKFEYRDLNKVNYTETTIKKKYSEKKFTVKADVNSEKATYTSSNKKVATVSKNGEVTIKGCGWTDILIETPADGNEKKAYKKVRLGVSPNKQSITSVVSEEKGQIKITWKKNSCKNVRGYLVEYSTDKNFKKNCGKIVYKVTSKDTSEEMSRSFGGDFRKTYYVRIRACGNTISRGDGIYDYELTGECSEVKKVKVK